MVDVIIIGGGPAGYEAALLAAKHDKRVILIEKDKLGGTCLQEGCIPTKYMLQNLKEVNKYEKEELVSTLEKGIRFLIDKAKITYINGTARLIDGHHVSVNGDVYETKFILLATGSTNRTLSFKGSEYMLSSKEILTLDHLDVKKILIVGAGVIGLEFASFYSAIGVEVILVEFLDKIMNGWDKDLQSNYRLALRKQKIDVRTNCSIKEIEKNETCLKVTLSDSTMIEVDKVLMCVGRQALKIESEIELEVVNSRLIVNENQQSSIKTIYGAGDCCSPLQLAHLASSQARNAIRHMFNLPNFENTSIVPKVLYVTPQLASVGSSEGTSVKVTMNSSGMATIQKQDRGFVKLVKENNYLTGAHLMMNEAGEVITLLTTAIVLKTPISELLSIVYPHPSLSETIKEALVQLQEKKDEHIV